MAKPITIPNTFASATSAIPLSQLDQDFSTLANATNDLATYSNYVADTGAADAYIANFPANTNTSSLTAGLTVQFKAANANTGASTLNVQVNGASIGTAAIRYANGSSLAAGAIAAGAMVSVMYDGTNFQLINDPAGQSGGDVTGPASATDNAIARFDGATGKLIQNSVVTIADTTGDMSGIGTLSAGNVTVSGTANAASLIVTGVGTFAAGTVSAPSITFTGDTNTGIYSPAADTIAFTEGGVESMRIDSSGNVGIGTSSPSGWNGRTLSVASSTNDAGIRLDGNLGSWGIGGGGTATGSNALRFYNFTSSFEAMRIDSSGNVGIGTTSPVNVSNQKSITIDATTVSRIDFRSGGTARFNLQASSTETTFANEGLTPFVYYTNGAERMRITSAGNVGIGTSSPTTFLQIDGTNVGFRGQLSLNGGSGNIAQLTLYNGATTQTNLTGQFYSSGDNVGVRLSAYQATGYIAFETAANTERMRIDSSGNVLGASTTGMFRISNSARSALLPTYAFVNAADVGMYNPADGTLGFVTGQVERMRINSGGYLKASNNGAYVSSTGPYHEFISNDASNGVAVVESTNASYTSYALFVGAARNTANNSYYAIGYFNRAALAYRFLVADSGNVTNTNGSYGTISDIKNKENIVDATPKLDKVNQLKVRNYNFKGDDLKQIGFVAQEFEEVFPSMVEEHHDKDAEGNDLGTTTKSIKTSVLVPILVKAIQEQQAMIEELKQEVAALKAK